MNRAEKTGNRNAKQGRRNATQGRRPIERGEGNPMNDSQSKEKDWNSCASVQISSHRNGFVLSCHFK